MPSEVVSESIWCRVQHEALDISECMRFAEVERAGAVVLFSGNVRDHSQGRPGVVSLFYEAYEEQVVASFTSIANEAMSRWNGICRIVVHHRLGECFLGESTVIVVVSSEHRDSGFEAARFCIDTLKVASPIWKKEHWAGGSEWALGANQIRRIGEL